MSEKNGFQDIPDIFVEKFTQWAEMALEHTPNFIVSLLILIAFYLIACLVAKAMQKVMHRTMQSRQVANLLLSIIRVVIIGVGCFVALDFLGLKGTVTSLLAGAGIVGLALGFAFQDMTENFIAGVVMGIRKPFRPGDVIETNEVLGEVKEMNLRNTLVHTFPGQIEIVPNKHLFRNVLRNYSYTGERRIDIAVGISYADDIDRAHKAISNALNSLDGVIRKDETSAYAEGFGDSSIDLVARFWINYPETDFLKVRHQAVVAIKKALDEEDILIPFPIRTLDFGAKGGQKLDQSVVQIKSRA